MAEQLAIDGTGGMQRTARLSECGSYRYSLGRVWDPKLPTYLAIGLNPSTADASTDDATVRRWIGYGRSWGFGGFHVLNLYAYRATDPRVLWRERDHHVDIVGPTNDDTIRRHLRDINYRKAFGETVGIVLCCWGANADQDREGDVLDLIDDADFKPMALAVTKMGFPQHPLRLPGHLKPRPLSELRREAGFAG